jgi:hypothetical protein
LIWKQQNDERETVSNATALRQDPLYHIPVHIGQSVVTTLKSKCKSSVIKTHQMQNRRVQIVHMNRILNDVKTQIVRFSPNEPFLKPAASHPHTVTAIVVIPAIVPTLDHRRPTKLATPDD